MKRDIVLPFKVLQAFTNEGKAYEAGSYIGLTEADAKEFVAGYIEEVKPEMKTHTVDQETLDMNPAFVEMGMKVGETFQYPVYPESVLREAGILDAWEKEADLIVDGVVKDDSAGV